MATQRACSAVVVASDLFGHSASSSSRKRIAHTGEPRALLARRANRAANRNAARRRVAASSAPAAPPPGPSTLTEPSALASAPLNVKMLRAPPLNATSGAPKVAATVRTRCVLPVPGGPESKAPDGGRMEQRRKSSACGGNDALSSAQSASYPLRCAGNMLALAGLKLITALPAVELTVVGKLPCCGI